MASRSAINTSSTHRRPAETARTCHSVHRRRWTTELTTPISLPDRSCRRHVTSKTSSDKYPFCQDRRDVQMLFPSTSEATRDIRSGLTEVRRIDVPTYTVYIYLRRALSSDNAFLLPHVVTLYEYYIPDCRYTRACAYIRIYIVSS